MTLHVCRKTLTSNVNSFQETGRCDSDENNTFVMRLYLDAMSNYVSISGFGPISANRTGSRGTPRQMRRKIFDTLRFVTVNCCTFLVQAYIVASPPFVAGMPPSVVVHLLCFTLLMRYGEYNDASFS